MNRLILLISFLGQSCLIFSQYTEETIKLPNELNEVSGIAFVNDSIFAAINDSGNEPKVFFVNTKGQIIQKAVIESATNIDWEDLVYVDSILYIGDFGNNGSNRKNLCIYKVDLKYGWKNDKLPSEKIEFSYANQTEFPPLKEEEMKFDCEAFYFSEGQLHLLTKNIHKSCIGRSGLYSMSTEKRTYSVSLKNKIKIPAKDWLDGAITGATIYDSVVTILTYKKIVILNKNNLNSQLSTYKFESLRQREGICQTDANTYYVISERHKIFGGPYLTKLKRKE